MKTATEKNLLPGLLLAITGAIAFSGKAIIVKLAYRYGVDAVTLIMLRMLFALPIFAAMAWWAGRGKAPLSRRDWLGVIGLGFSGYYLSSFLDFAGLQYISASLERLILYLNPTFVMLLAWLLYRKRFDRLAAGVAWLWLAGLQLPAQRPSHHPLQQLPRRSLWPLHRPALPRPIPSPPLSHRPCRPTSIPGSSRSLNSSARARPRPSPTSTNVYPTLFRKFS